MDGLDDVEIGQWVYLWHKHFKVTAIDGHLVQIVPANRPKMKPHVFDWVLRSKVLRYGKPSGRED